MYVHIYIYIFMYIQCIYIYTHIYIYMYISAEASMASGRVDAQPPILKTLSSLQSGEGFPPLTPPTAPARLVGGSLGKSRTPRAPQGLPKQPPRSQKDPQCPPKNLQMLKTQQKQMLFQCFHKPPMAP